MAALLKLLAIGTAGAAALGRGADDWELSPRRMKLATGTAIAGVLGGLIASEAAPAIAASPNQPAITHSATVSKSCNDPFKCSTPSKTVIKAPVIPKALSSLKVEEWVGGQKVDPITREIRKIPDPALLETIVVKMIPNKKAMKGHHHGLKATVSEIDPCALEAHPSEKVTLYTGKTAVVTYLALCQNFPDADGGYAITVKGKKTGKAPAVRSRRVVDTRGVVLPPLT